VAFYAFTSSFSQKRPIGVKHSVAATLEKLCKFRVATPGSDVISYSPDCFAASVRSTFRAPQEFLVSLIGSFFFSLCEGTRDVDVDCPKTSPSNT